MKKLLAVVLALSLVSVTSAATLTWDVTDVDATKAGVQVNQNSTFEVRAITDVASNAFALNVLLTGNFTGYDPVAYNPGYTSPTLSSVGTKIDPGYIKNIGGRMSAPTTDPAIPAGQWVYKFNVTAGASGLITIDDYKGVIGSGMAVKTTLNGTEIFMNALDVEINSVPEPISVALLGLGGLFLRRRKQTA